MAEGGAPQASAFGAAQRIAASLGALFRIRLELFSIEVQEETERAATLLFWAVLAALTVGFGLVFVALAVTVALWDSHRLLALGVSAVLFVALAAFSVRRALQLVQASTHLFEASLGELKADEAALRGTVEHR